MMVRFFFFCFLSSIYQYHLTDQVIRVSRPPPSTTHASDSEGSPAAVASPLPDEDGDVEMAAAEDPQIKPQPRKRKPKKVIPVGRNGLKKRRVEKSRTSFDEKGYMGRFPFFFSIYFMAIFVMGWIFFALLSVSHMWRLTIIFGSHGRLLFIRVRYG